MTMSRWISGFAVTVVCKILGVSRSGFCACRDEIETERQRADRELSPLVCDVFWRHKSERLTAISSSDLRRAYETAGPIAELKGLPVRTDPRLWEGRWSFQERGSEYPVLPFDAEEEDYEDVQVRVVSALTEIVSSNAGGSVLVVSHGGACEEFVRFVTPSEAGRFRGARTALSRFQYDGNTWSCLELDDDRHLSHFRNDDLEANAG